MGTGGDTRKKEFLRKVIDSLENSEFDPKLAENWIKEPNPNNRAEICQQNFASGFEIDFNSIYMMMANTQIGKTNSFLFLIFKAGVTKKMPSIIMTQNGKSEPDRFNSSIKKFNKLLKAHGARVQSMHRPKFEGLQVRAVASQASSTTNQEVFSIHAFESAQDHYYPAWVSEKSGE